MKYTSEKSSHKTLAVNHLSDFNTKVLDPSTARKVIALQHNLHIVELQHFKSY